MLVPGEGAANLSNALVALPNRVFEYTSEQDTSPASPWLSWTNAQGERVQCGCPYSAPRMIARHGVAGCPGGALAISRQGALLAIIFIVLKFKELLGRSGGIRTRDP